MKEFLKHLDVKVSSNGKGRYSVVYKNEVIGYVIKHKDIKMHPWTLEFEDPVKAANQSSHILYYSTFLDAIQNLLGYNGMNATPLLSHIKLDPVILRISNPRLLHDKDLDNPEAKIVLLCTVVYSKPARINEVAGIYATNRGGWVTTDVDKPECISCSDAIIDFNEDKIILPNGKELQAVNVKSMIESLRSHLGGKKE